MKDWSDKFRLLAVLSTTSTLLAHSPNEGFGIEEPSEATEQIEQMIASLFFGSGKPLPLHWRVLFAPTGPLQEISMANGWSEAYIKLSSEFDSLEHLANEYEVNRGHVGDGDPRSSAGTP